ncbi:MAG TPA: CoA transferase [Gaiellaceae bacterium]|nr:CoA transferase [Gaiellaceae bacterium]
MSELPLDGLRILDLSRVLAGPYCTMVLSDLGAEVVKIERPGAGDETRAWGPPFVEGESAYFLSVNRGKRSVALDLRGDLARAAFMRLAANADVVVENFRTGGADALGVGYEHVRAVNPRVVYCSITGFGPREPAGRPGYDFVIQAESGLMSITGEAEGAPSKVGVAVVDVLAGLNAAVAILAALRRREDTGGGAHVEVSLLDSALSGLVNVAQSVLVTGEEAPRFGNAHRSVAPYEPLRAEDGLVAVAAANDGLFAKLCAALGRNDLHADPRFATNAGRVEHRAALAAELERTLTERPAAEWIELLNAEGVPAGKIRGVLEALEAAGDEARMSVEHPAVGPLELVRTAPRFDAPPPPVPPPLLGQHTREVLREIGLDDAEVDALAAESAGQS